MFASKNFINTGNAQKQSIFEILLKMTIQKRIMKKRTQKDKKLQLSTYSYYQVKICFEIALSKFFLEPPKPIPRTMLAKARGQKESGIHT